MLAVLCGLSLGATTAFVADKTVANDSTMVTTTAKSTIFSDVPVTDWSYTALGKLSKDGFIDGYDEGKFSGKRHFSRFEIATIIANAGTKVAQASNGDKDIIRNLQVAYKGENEGVH